MDQTVLDIEGMTCDHCVQAVQGALASVPGVVKVEVSLPSKRAVVIHAGPLDIGAARTAVEGEGYQVNSRS